MRANIAHPWSALASILLALSGAACGGSDDTDPTPGEGSGTEQPDFSPPTGATDFVSADAVAGATATRDGAEFGNVNGDAAGDLAAPATMAGAGATSAMPREVAEGDIYRVLGDGLILNLNSYRGLQVIDVSDPSAPRIVGRHVVVGTPVEMYVRGDRALVLLNDWNGYYGSRDDVRVERREGGLLLAVDLSDPTAPAAVGSVFIEGYVRKSRLVSNDVSASLYVASSASGEVTNAQGYQEWVERTVVTSFDVGGSSLAKKTELDLGGYVQDIQATPDALLVAGSDYSTNTQRNMVSIVDISDPAGTMVQGDSVATSGYVQSQFNLDLHQNVLRVVSTNWNGLGNTLQTFDANDIHDVKPLDSCTFGGSEQLYATLFLGEKAFFVTYLRQDPFHAFSIAADGTCEERAEFIVSGWNDFLRPVASATRLIGIGTDDEGGGQAPAVSLYDITNLDNPTPLLSRAQAAELQWSWSEASYDHRAFSVLEGAVDVAAADGTAETGLVLLPYSGYTNTSANGGSGQYVSGVQIFTFSDRSVTQRGAMTHDSEVRRSFLANPDTTVNLSETTLALYDHTDPTAPERLGSVELAPDFARVLRFGDYVARVKRPSYDYQAYDYGAEDEVAPSLVQIVPASADPNEAAAVAELEVPVDARLLKAGDLLLSIVYRVVGLQNEWPYDYETTVQIHDLSDPTHPVERGSAVSQDLLPTYDGYGGYRGGWYGGPDGFGVCGVGDFWFGGNQVDGTLAIGDALVFTQTRDHDELLGTQNVCSYYPRYNPACDTGCEDYLTGYRECTSLDGGPEQCREELYLCDQSTTVDAASCEQVEFDDVRVQLEMSCWNGEQRRYWSSYEMAALDLRNPDAPAFSAPIRMPAEEEGVRVLPLGSSLYYSYKIPTTVEGDPRAHVRYFFKELDFANPADPAVSAAVNIPGELIAVDGERLYTSDLRWTDDRAETFVHELVREGDLAYLQASRRFEEREVSKVVVADSQLLVSHGPTYNDYFGPSGEDALVRLTMLGARGLQMRGEVEVDSWSTLEAVHDGRALYTVPGGLLVVNVEDPTAPFAQGFFNTNGWPEQILFEGGEITIAAGRYGIHRFDATAFNLLTE